MKKNQKYFRIVRYYLNGDLQFAQEIREKDQPSFMDYLESINYNQTGGLTYWFRIDIQPLP
jgi:hypothetical protein